MWPFQNKKQDSFLEKEVDDEMWTPVHGYEERYVQNEKGNWKDIKTKDIWTPVPGYENYYLQNPKYRYYQNTGKEFDMNMKNCKDETDAAACTMSYVSGFLGDKSNQAYNLKKIYEVIKNQGWGLSVGMKHIEQKYIDKLSPEQKEEYQTYKNNIEFFKKGKWQMMSFFKKVNDK